MYEVRRYEGGAVKDSCTWMGRQNDQSNLPTPQTPHYLPSKVSLLGRQVVPATDLNRSVAQAVPHDGSDADHLGAREVKCAGLMRDVDECVWMGG